LIFAKSKLTFVRRVGFIFTFFTLQNQKSQESGLQLR